MKKSVVIAISVFASIFSVLLLIGAVRSISKTLKEGPLPTDMPRPVSCQIMVVQDGKPLEGATVVFHNLEPSKANWNIRGTTDSKGIAEMKSMEKWFGAVPGEYKVTISKHVGEEGLDPKYDSVPNTPVQIVVKRSFKLKVDVGPFVSRPRPTFSRDKDIDPKDIKYYPCNITLLKNGESLKGVELDLSRSRSGHESFSFPSLKYRAVSDADGIVSFYSEEIFGKDKQKFDGLPSGEYTIFGSIKYETYDERFRMSIPDFVSYRDKIIITEAGFDLTIDVADLK